MNHSGIIYSSSSDGSKTHLPLEEVRVSALILDVTAKVTLVQLFSNPGDVATTRCKYYFPVPASAAICSFQMKTSNGRVVNGVCKEKNIARQEFEQAIRAGKFAGMLEYVTDDIFTISVGSIPPQSTAEVKLVYVMSLMNDDIVDGIRFHLPRAVGERYGVPPADLVGADVPFDRTRIRLKLEIQTGGRIESIQCPSHPGDISEIKYPTDHNRPSYRRTTVRYHSRSFLERDFVLVVHAENLDAPRCFEEHYKNPVRSQADSIALQLTLVPKFDLEWEGSQEYLFLIDRSGSMAGERVATAKETLALLLRMLPQEKSTFNIFSFGTSHSSLWPQGQPYNEHSLATATSHVDSMSANLGGTEIRGALESVFRSRSNSTAVAVFVLTDGESYDINETVASVQQAVQGTSTRVFVLGIGESVSTAMCEGIARAGNGIALFSTCTESILGRCARLLRAGRTPYVKDVTIDWGIPPDSSASSPSVSFTDSNAAHSWRPPNLQQAPRIIEDVHAGARMNIFAILNLRRVTVPKEVRLRGRIEHSNKPFEFVIPIRGQQLKDPEPHIHMVHTMAAWRLIQEHAEKRVVYLNSSGIPEDDLRKASIVRLGEQYQLVSPHTSFVAVESGSDYARESSPVRSTRSRSSSSVRSNSSDASSDLNDMDLQGLAEPWSGSSISGLLFNAVTRWTSWLFRPASNTSRRGESRYHVPGSWPRHGGGRSDGSDADDGDDGDSASVATFSTLSTLEDTEENWSDWSSEYDNGLPRMTEDDYWARNQPSPKLAHRSLAPDLDIDTPRPSRVNYPPKDPVLVQPLRPEVVQMIRMQEFDGSFTLNDHLRKLVGPNAMAEAKKLQVGERLWATALVIAYVAKRSGGQKDLVADLLAKACKYLRQNARGEEMLKHAQGVVR
ncbi:hypothetical protein BDN72DRAFT_753479 [Pluteus cervinus]|uniref:Uncharacterized protein n=1 Tax=Pluteus cervinus TaxID=181527 RepID=A0ACD3BGD0_9AGAR|nr:hypothetical protein BDN72DRAFT_753479 [Pluteus cervinus]